MCWKCELRDRAREGDEEAQLTLKALEDQDLALIWPLLLGEALLASGLTEISVDPRYMKPNSKFAGVQLVREGDKYIASLVKHEDVEAIKASVLLQDDPRGRLTVN